MAVKIIVRADNCHSPDGHGLAIESMPEMPIVPIAAIRAAFDATMSTASNKIWVIKIVRAFTGYGLKEAKDMVDFYIALKALAKTV